MLGRHTHLEGTHAVDGLDGTVLEPSVPQLLSRCAAPRQKRYAATVAGTEKAISGGSGSWSPIFNLISPVLTLIPLFFPFLLGGFCSNVSFTVSFWKRIK